MSTGIASPTGMESRRTGAEELTITTSCPACDRAFEVALELRPSADRVRPVTIGCPYCRKEARIDTSRRLLWVATVDVKDTETNG